MKKIYLIVSALLFLVFCILFIKNIFEEFDVFYVAWGTIAFPVSIVLLRSKDKYNEFILFGLLLLGGLYLLDTYVFVVGEPSYGMPVVEPGPTLFGVLISLIGITILLVSYALVVLNYKEYDKIHYILQGVIIVLFLISIVLFLKNTVLEYTFGILLFFALLTQFTLIFFKSFKKLFT